MNPNLPPMHRLRVRALPDDMVRKVLDQLVEGTPPEDLCGRLYERCLLLLGSGQCPPDHPIWAQACRRFGVLQKGEGLGTWQATFRAFCKEVARLPPYQRATLWRYVRGEEAAVPYEDFNALLNFFTQPSETATLPLGYFFPVVRQALWHFGLRDPETAEFLRAFNGRPNPDVVGTMLQLIDGHPRQGVLAMIRAIERRGDPVREQLIPALLDAGVPTETLVREGETLLHYAVRMRNAYAVAQLLLVGADQTARNAEGWTAAEMAKIATADGWLNSERRDGYGVIWASNAFLDNSKLQEIFQFLWPEAAAEWLAMSDAERRVAAVNGWSPGGT